MRALSRDVWEVMIRTVERTALPAPGRGVLVPNGRQKAADDTAFGKKGVLTEASHGTPASPPYITTVILEAQRDRSNPWAVEVNGLRR